MFKNSPELVNNIMQIMHYLNFYVQVPVACDWFKFGFDFFQTFCMTGLGFFQRRFWDFSS